MRIRLTIIGGSGFVGTSLVSRLRKIKLYDLKIIDKVLNEKFSEFVSIGDVRFLEKIEPLILEKSIIINLAAEHRDDVTPKSLYDETNVQGAKNVCEVARHKNIQKIIFTSSVAVYGFAPLGTNESGEINPFNDYGRTKWEAEKIYKE